MEYVPPDPTVIEVKRESLDFWAKTLETDPESVRRAVKKAGPLVEDVKRELGSYGVG